MGKKKEWTGWLLFFFFLLVGISFLSLLRGAVPVPLSEIFQIGEKIIKGEKISSHPLYPILFQVRLPRILAALLVGASLSVAGVILQGMFRNPLVEPYTLGVSGGAAVGITLSILFGLTLPYFFPLTGLLGAIGGIVLVYFIASSGGRLALPTLLLSGVMVSFFSSSLIMLIMSLASPSQLQGILYWTMGSLQSVSFKGLKVGGGVMLGGIIFAFFFIRELNALTLGEEEASWLGINVERTKKILFFLSSLLTGGAVALTGVIGFVGLMVPHLVRGVVGTDHRILLPASCLLGGSFLVGADLLARTVASPLELPVGVITGVAGAIIFIYCLRIRKVEFRW